MEIYPSILAYSKLEFAAKVEHVRPLGLRVHIDVMDGVFVAGRTWADPSEVQELLQDMPFNVHLMVSSPEHAVPIWAVSGPDCVYFHVESTYRHKLIMRAVKQDEIIGIALNPNTPVSQIGHLLDRISSVLIMSVFPGRSGQEFLPNVLEKIREVKRLRPELHVVVDGGIKPHNIAAVAEAGADAVIIGSALTDSPDPEAALYKFQQQLQKVEAVTSI
ncbi:MAG: ribulose-phosphate 3-epimerase [Patescibacteria group bacterium]